MVVKAGSCVCVQRPSRHRGQQDHICHIYLQYLGPSLPILVPTGIHPPWPFVLCCSGMQVCRCAGVQASRFPDAYIQLHIHMHMYIPRYIYTYISSHDICACANITIKRGSKSVHMLDRRGGPSAGHPGQKLCKMIGEGRREVPSLHLVSIPRRLQAPYWVRHLGDG